MDNKQLLQSLVKITNEILDIKKRIKRYMVLGILCIVLTIIFLICGITFAVFAGLNKGTTYTVLCIVFFVLFLISLQLCLALFYIVKKVLITKLKSYVGIEKVLEQEKDKEKC